MKLDTGTRVGPYEITGWLGAGGMGEVYRAHDDRLRRDVAIKLMNEPASGDATRLRQMQQEARAIGQLSHPNILGVFDVGIHDDRMYIVTELLEGESLRALVQGGAVPWRTAVAFALQIAEALSAAHESGIIHRDIKPDNVFLLKSGRLKVLDFGVAKRRAPLSSGGQTATAETLSQSGTLIGTIGYMSPEQARGQEVDARSDLFAFGCLLYELLAGVPAFRGATPVEILVAIQRDTPASLEELSPGTPVALIRIVERCLEKDADRRFQSARDLAFSLSQLSTDRTTAGRGEVAVTVAKAPRFGPRVRVGLLVAAGLLLAGASGAVLSRVTAPVKEVPRFGQMTFRRGTVYTARFTLDGGSIVYSAAWDGLQRELYASVPGTRDVRSLSLPETDVTHFLAAGEVAVIRRSRAGFSKGTLGRVSLAGGRPKDMLEGVNWADGSPDGTKLLVVKRANGVSTLEHPPGHPIAEGPAITYPRFSPDGRRIAFLRHSTPPADAGTLVVVDADGRKVMETPIWKSIEGLAWRSNDVLWFTASREGRSLWLHAVDLRGKIRLLERVPGRLVLHDLSSDGRALAERNSLRCTLFGGTAQGQEQDLSWQDYSQLGQLSRDGKQLLFSEEGDGAGAAVTSYLRPLQGGAPLRLGEGSAMALSADGTQALLLVDEGGQHLEIVPVGAGRPIRLSPGRLTAIRWAAILPGAARVLVLGKEAQESTERLYVQDVAGEPRLLSSLALQINGDAVSPDGTVVAALEGGKTILVPLDGSPPRPLPGIEPGFSPIGFSRDGSSLFLRDAGLAPTVIHRYQIATAKLERWKTLSPTDAAGVLEVGRVGVALDGDAYVYESYRLLSDLYVIEGLD